MSKSKLIGSVSLQLLIMNKTEYVYLAKLLVNYHGFIFKESIKPLGMEQKFCRLLSELEKYIEGQNF